jgi:hypothetical protein
LRSREKGREANGERGDVGAGIVERNVRGPREMEELLLLRCGERRSRMALIIASQFIETEVCVFYSPLPMLPTM